MILNLWRLKFFSALENDFLGAVIIPGRSFEDAIQRAWQLDLNPGGDVRGKKISPLSNHMIPAENIGRMLDREECEAFL